MNQRLCYFFKDGNDLQDFVKKDLNEVLLSTNKYRVCIFLSDEFNKITEINSNSSITVYEVMTHSFAYEKKEDWQRVDQFLVSDKPNKIWIQDIDIWINLDAFLVEQLEQKCGHMFFYTDKIFFQTLKNKII